MRGSFGKWVVAGLVCAGFCFANVGARADGTNAAMKKAASAKEQTTVTGAAKAVANKSDPTKKHLELTDKAGTKFLLLSKKITAEQVAKFDGKNITVSGTTKDNKDGGKTIYVSGDITEAK